MSGRRAAENTNTTPNDVRPTDRDLARADARYVLEWLRQCGAPENIIGLQECVVRVAHGLPRQDNPTP